MAAVNMSNYQDGDYMADMVGVEVGASSVQSSDGSDISLTGHDHRAGAAERAELTERPWATEGGVSPPDTGNDNTASPATVQDQDPPHGEAATSSHSLSHAESATGPPGPSSPRGSGTNQPHNNNDNDNAQQAADDPPYPLRQATWTFNGGDTSGPPPPPAPNKNYDPETQIWCRRLKWGVLKEGSTDPNNPGHLGLSLAKEVLDQPREGHYYA